MRGLYCRAAVSAVAVLLVSACTPTAPQEPTPTPTPVQSPTETAQERQQRLDYEAAEQAYRASTTELDRLYNAGAAEISNELRQLSTPKRQRQLHDFLDQLHRSRWHTTGGTQIVGVVRNGWSSDKLGLLACEDISGERLLKGTRDVTPNTEKFYLQRVELILDTTWKVDASETTKLNTLEGQVCAE